MFTIFVKLYVVILIVDETEIGERGINLSGGQKARVGFARLLFAAAQSDIILLDDPFSAVDGQTGDHMFQQGIMKGLVSKTTLVVLNSYMHLVNQFDRVIIMKHGRIVAFDTPVSCTKG